MLQFTFSKVVSPHVIFEGPGYHWCSILSYAHLFFCVFFAEVSSQVFWPLVIYLYDNTPAFAYICGGYRNAAPCPARLTFLTSLSSPSRPSTPPFLLCFCLTSLWSVSLNIVSGPELHSPGCILLTEEDTKASFILLQCLPSLAFLSYS